MHDCDCDCDHDLKTQIPFHNLCDVTMRYFLTMNPVLRVQLYSEYVLSRNCFSTVALNYLAYPSTMYMYQLAQYMYLDYLHYACVRVGNHWRQ